MPAPAPAGEDRRSAVVRPVFPVAVAGFRMTDVVPGRIVGARRARAVRLPVLAADVFDLHAAIGPAVFAADVAGLADAAIIVDFHLRLVPHLGGVFAAMAQAGHDGGARQAAALQAGQAQSRAGGGAPA